jgi:hypothetical protein
MADIDGMRCCLVANILVHATTSVSRTELQAIFGNVNFRMWLAILDNPDLPGLILAPVHELQGIADATEAELRRFSAPLDENGNRLQSRGTQWLASVLEGAQNGAMQGVDPLMSLKQVRLAGRAAERDTARTAAQARKAKKAMTSERGAAASASKKATSESKAAKKAAHDQAADEAAAASATAKMHAAAATAAAAAAAIKPPAAAAAKPPAAAQPPAAAKKAKPTDLAIFQPQPPAKAAKAVIDKKIKESKAEEADDVLVRATPSPHLLFLSCSPSFFACSLILSNLNLCICSLQVDLEVGSHCWYTPINNANGKGRRRIEIKGTKTTITGDVRFIFTQQSKGKPVFRAVKREELTLIRRENADEEVKIESAKIEPEVSSTAKRKAERKELKAKRRRAADAERQLAESAEKVKLEEQEAAHQGKVKANHKALRKAARKATRKAERKAKRKAACKATRKAERKAEMTQSKGPRVAGGGSVRKVITGTSVEQQSIIDQISVLRLQISANSDNTSRIVQLGEKHRLELALERINGVR